MPSSTCPHCHLETIGYFAKHASWRGGPIECRGCGGLAYVSASEAAYSRKWGYGFVAVVMVVLLTVAWYKS